MPTVIWKTTNRKGLGWFDLVVRDDNNTEHIIEHPLLDQSVSRIKRENLLTVFSENVDKHPVLTEEMIEPLYQQLLDDDD